MVFLGSKTVGWEECHLWAEWPLYWLVPGSDCHFTYEHGDNSVSRH